MARLGTASARAACVLLALALGIQCVQPQGAAAQPTTPLGKALCNVSVSASCPATTSTTTVSAVPGNQIQYNLIYTPSGAAASVIISDQLQAGQTFVTGSCRVLTGTAATCSYTAPVVTFTIPAAPATVAETVAFNVVVNSGAPGTISNQVTASANGAPTPPSNITTVSVSTSPSTGMTLSKTVADVSGGNLYGASGYYTTGMTVRSGDRLRYSVTINNGTGTNLTGITLSDPLQMPGQSFIQGSCSVACTFDGRTVTFSITSLAPGPYTVTFDVYVTTPSYTTGSQIFNTASATATNAAPATSNTTVVTVAGAPYVPPTVYPPFVGVPTVSTIQICGVVTAYNPGTAVPLPYNPGATAQYNPGNGYFTMNGVSFWFAPYFAPGTPVLIGNNVCATITFNSYGQVTSLVITSNLPAVNYACGNVSPFVPGYNPYPGFMPYPGYNPYPTGAGATYGPYPYGNTGTYGYYGPIMIGGYPFPVSSGTYFPFYPNYGNPYCFLMNQQGYVTGSVSAVPVAAFVAEEPSGYRAGHVTRF